MPFQIGRKLLDCLAGGPKEITPALPVPMIAAGNRRGIGYSLDAEEVAPPVAFAGENRALNGDKTRYFIIGSVAFCHAYTVLGSNATTRRSMNFINLQINFSSG